MDFPRINLHIHTNFSDGENSIKEIVVKSLKLGLNYIAITDHFSNSWKANLIATLDTAEKIERYLTEIRKCQNYLKIHNKYLGLYKGLEIDIGSSEEVIKKFIRPECFDLILFEYLETFEGLTFIKNIIEYWKKSITLKNFPLLGLAHFDPSLFISGGLDILLNFLKNYNIYFEFNSRYSEYYSQRNQVFFKKLKEKNIHVAIGSDAHNSRNLDDIEEPLNVIRSYNLENSFKAFLNLLKQR
ncbi:MAG: PHP domain-containing protein [Promethearchaeota archaeon]